MFPSTRHHNGGILVLVLVIFSSCYLQAVATDPSKVDALLFSSLGQIEIAFGGTESVSAQALHKAQKEHRERTNTNGKGRNDEGKEQQPSIEVHWPRTESTATTNMSAILDFVPNLVSRFPTSRENKHTKKTAASVVVGDEQSSEDTCWGLCYTGVLRFDAKEAFFHSPSVQELAHKVMSRGEDIPKHLHHHRLTDVVVQANSRRRGAQAATEHGSNKKFTKEEELDYFQPHTSGLWDLAQLTFSTHLHNRERPLFRSAMGEDQDDKNAKKKRQIRLADGSIAFVHRPISPQWVIAEERKDVHNWKYCMNSLNGLYFDSRRGTCYVAKVMKRFCGVLTRDPKSDEWTLETQFRKRYDEKGRASIVETFSGCVGADAVHAKAPSHHPRQHLSSSSTFERNQWKMKAPSQQDDDEFLQEKEGATEEEDAASEPSLILYDTAPHGLSSRGMARASMSGSEHYKEPLMVEATFQLCMDGGAGNNNADTSIIHKQNAVDSTASGSAGGGGGADDGRRKNVMVQQLLDHEEAARRKKEMLLKTAKFQPYHLVGEHHEALFLRDIAEEEGLHVDAVWPERTAPLEAEVCPAQSASKSRCAQAPHRCVSQEEKKRKAWLVHGEHHEDGSFLSEGTFMILLGFFLVFAVFLMALVVSGVGW